MFPLTGPEVRPRLFMSDLIKPLPIPVRSAEELHKLAVEAEKAHREIEKKLRKQYPYLFSD